MWRFLQHENEGILAKLQSVEADVVAKLRKAESELENTSSGVLLLFIRSRTAARDKILATETSSEAQGIEEEEQIHCYSNDGRGAMAAVLSSDHIRKLELTRFKKDEQLTRFKKAIRGWEETT